MRQAEYLRFLKSCVNSKSLMIGLVLTSFSISPATAATTANGAEQKAQTSPQKLKVSLLPSPKIETQDGRNQIRLASFLQYDGVQAFGDAPGQRDGATLRRARFGFRGFVAKDWKYNFMLEGATGDIQLFDANVSYTGFKNVTLSVGQFKEPMGLEWASGCPWWTFMDRSLVASLTPKRSQGFAIATGGEKWRAKLAYFADGATMAKAPSEDGGLTGRFYVAPIHNKKTTLHFGVSASMRHQDPSPTTLAFKAKHETARANAAALNTGVIDQVDGRNLMAGEALFIKGPFSVQAEYARAKADRIGAASVDFSSYYIEGSVFVIGGARNYKFKKGAIAAPKLNKSSKIGAIELAARYDTLDLDDRDITGGVMDRYTAGVNWYTTKHIRLTTNYVHSSSKRANAPQNIKRDSIAVRAQLAF